MELSLIRTITIGSTTVYVVRVLYQMKTVFTRRAVPQRVLFIRKAIQRDHFL